MSFPLCPKLTRNEWLTFAIGKALSDRVADKRPRMASLNLGELLRQLKSAYWKLLRFWAVDGQHGNYRFVGRISTEKRYDSIGSAPAGVVGVGSTLIPGHFRLGRWTKPLVFAADAGHLWVLHSVPGFR